MRPSFMILFAFVGACALALTGARADAAPKPKCPGDVVVWVNVTAKTYVNSENSNFGKYSDRVYKCLAAARAEADIEYAPHIRVFAAKIPWHLRPGLLLYVPFRLDPPGVYVFANCVASGGGTPSCTSDSSTGGYTCENGDPNAETTRNLLLLSPNTPVSPSGVARFSAIVLTSEPIGKAPALSCALTLLDSSGNTVTYTFNAPAQPGL